MFILLSYIGPLPEYTIYCIHQIRLYCNNDIYLITNDLNSHVLNKIKKYNVKIIPYEQILTDETIHIFTKFYDKFLYLHGKTGAEELFLRSIERFYLAHNLMNKCDIDNCLFLEIDNLIYDDPNKWTHLLARKPFSLMSHANNHCSTGICFIRDKHSLINFIEYSKYYISRDNPNKDILSEMVCWYEYKNRTKNNDIQVLPIVFSNTIQNDIPEETYECFNDFQSIFDGLAYGIYLLGEDKCHHNSVVKKGITNDWFIIHGGKYKYTWITDTKGYKKPYILDENNNKWILINNLHVHGKNLEEGISFSL